jgi:flotillin
MVNFQIPLAFLDAVFGVGATFLLLILIGGAFSVLTCFRKVEQGRAIIRNGLRGTKVSFSGLTVFPIIDKAEYMDISVKRVEIDRNGSNGLICMDNMRADIKVAFFVRVNQTPEAVLKVAQSIGCVRASSQNAIVELFDAKLSEGLKTVGRQFQFVDLYNSRDKLKEGILQSIGTDLNGFVLEDVAIDYLEQTPVSLLNHDNILDAEGIKKIIELTAAQKILANQIDREREKTITKQNVEATETILALNRQLAEAQEKQKREISGIVAREEAESKKVQAEQRLRSEQARIAVDEELQVAEENKSRQIIVAQRNKERTDGVEKERVEKDRALEQIDRERLVALAQIAKQKAVETEQKLIQNVIRERLEVEKTVVIEQQRIKDTEAFATADREKKVAVTAAEKLAESELIRDIKAAEAAKKSAELRADQEMMTMVRRADGERQAAERHAQQRILTADAELASAAKESEAKKMMAEAATAQAAAGGLAEAQVQVAKASALQKQGAAEAEVLQLKASAEAEGITRKAEAMKLFDAVGKEHEEFKLRLNKDQAVELAGIQVQANIASSQAVVISEALKNAHIDIVGGDMQFFDRITGAVSTGKAFDRLVQNSQTLSDVKDTFFNGDPEYFHTQVRGYIDRFGLGSEDIKNLSIATALTQMVTLADDTKTKGLLSGLLGQAKRLGLDGAALSSVQQNGLPRSAS